PIFAPHALVDLGELRPMDAEPLQRAFDLAHPRACVGERVASYVHADLAAVLVVLDDLAPGVPGAGEHARYGAEVAYGHAERYLEPTLRPALGAAHGADKLDRLQVGC